MVDSVQSFSLANLRLLQGQGQTRGQATDAAQAGGRIAGSGPAQPIRGADMTILDRATALADRGPSFDAVKVERIKQALSDGNYPVDFQRLTESLFQDYQALQR